MKIIDIHCHTSNHAMRNLHTASATIETLEKLADQHQVDLIVLMATYFPLKGTGVHNNDLLGRIRGHPRFKVFGSLDVMNELDSGVLELSQLATEGAIAGIKLYPGYQGFSPDMTKLYPVYELAQEHNLPVMFHGGELHRCCRKHQDNYPCGRESCPLDEFQSMAHPTWVAKVAEDFPDIKLVVSHLANPYFEALRWLMAKHHNVFTDISGQFLSGSSEDTEEYRQIIVAEIEKFLELPHGADRIMFATDFPIQSYADSFDLLNRLGLDSISQEKILGGTAEFILNKNKTMTERNQNE